MAGNEVRLRLVVILEGSVVAVHEFTGPSATIGRSSDCEVRLESATVSRKHVRLEKRDGAVVALDLGSRNGTYLNDRQIREELIESDTTIRVGTEFEVRIEFNPTSPHAEAEAATIEVPHHAARSPAAGAPSQAVSESKIVCPHCWREFDLSEILSVARHQDLVGDPVLGPGAAQRFLPSRFTPEGHALDARGMACPDLACPFCHLLVPRDLVDKPPIFLSIIGAPGTGKSYLLATMVWRLRTLMPRMFAFGFTDADSTSNQIVNEYERTLFMASDDEAWVTLEKTEMHGRMYDEVLLDNMRVSLPRPFMFSLFPQPHHPWSDRKDELTQTLALYDNAGEHFEPGADSAANPGTQHLSHSKGIFFLFDPTKDSRFRARCRSDDPQLKRGRRTERQEILLKDAFDRIRRQTGAPADQKYAGPVLVVVTKFDIWRDLLRTQPGEPWKRIRNQPTYVLDTDEALMASMAVRHLLVELCPELVSTAESLAKTVFYVPVSALGHSPTEDPMNPGSGLLMVRPKDIEPVWATAPMLSMWSLLGLLPATKAARPRGLPVAEGCRIYGDKVILTVPGVDVELETTRAYLGRPMRCPVSGALFWIPSAREIEEGARRG